MAGIHRVIGNDFGNVARPAMYLDAVLYANSVASTGNAIQNVSGTWRNANDVAQPGLPFQVYGTAVSAVPEPSTYLLLASALAAIAGVARRRRGR